MKIFIAGFLLMSVFSTISILLFDKNSDSILGVIFSGPVSWLLAFIAFIYREINHWIIYHDVRALLICPDGKIRYIKPNKVETMRDCADREYEFPDWKDFNGKEKWNISDWKIRWQDIGYTANVRYSPKKVWKKYEPISKEEFEYAKKHRYKYNSAEEI